MALFTSRRGYRARLYRHVIAVQALFARRRSLQPAGFIQYPPLQSPAEERANGLTHGVAALVSLIAAVWLIAAAVRQGDALMILGCAAYSASLTAVLTMSALSHIINLPRLRQLFRTLDQASIYMLTAGSCTPFFIRFLPPDGWGWMLPLLWGIALVGAWGKLRGDRVNSISIVFNVLLGWFPILAAQPLLARMPPGCLGLVLAAGGCYMLGVVFLCYDERRRYFHVVWHLLVVAASICTFAGIIIYVI